jgi:hypothetical protein
VLKWQKNDEIYIMKENNFYKTKSKKSPLADLFLDSLIKYYEKSTHTEKIRNGG